jgi:outer membrane protein OmpA-like peptidoglycan-associated protein
VTLGKTGWKKVVDAKPYMAQNDWLIEYSRSMDARHRQDSKALAEMRKILKIEGLLDFYNGSDGDNHKRSRIYPKNDYNGLNSLMARIGKGKEGDSFSKPDRGRHWRNQTAADSAFTKPSDDQSWNEYLLTMSNNRECIGSPIYFFFKIDTDVLIDRSQLINLDEIAQIAKKYNLRIRVTGAADSVTGTDISNEKLSSKRAETIFEHLVKRGVNDDSITFSSVGGINVFTPIQVNRNTKVELFFK